MAGCLPKAFAYPNYPEIANCSNKMSPQLSFNSPEVMPQACMRLFAAC